MISDTQCQGACVITQRSLKFNLEMTTERGGFYTNDFQVVETNTPYISDYEINILAKMILPKIQAFYESVEGKRKFEE